MYKIDIMTTDCIVQQTLLCCDRDGKEIQGRGGYMSLMHDVVQQKLTQHCKANIHQKKKKLKRLADH